MRLYRVLKPCKLGDVRIDPKKTPTIRLALSAQTERVALGKGALSLAQGPPVAALPGWEERGKVLAELGIVTVDDLLSVDAADIAQEVGRSVYTVKSWQKQLGKEIQ